MCMSVVVTNAQIRIMSTEQAFLDCSVAPAFVEISCPYVVKDKASDEVFRMEGKDNFNEVTMTAVRVKGGILAPRAALTPWTVDSGFKEYQNSYDGISLGLRIYSGNDTIVLKDVSSTRITPKNEDYYFVTIDSTVDGLTMQNPADNVEGWVVLLTRNKDSTLVTTSFRKKLSSKTHTEGYVLDRPLGLPNIVGGIFVVPVFPSIGTMEFRLCGIILEEGEKLTIITPEAPLSSISTTSANSNPSKALVPVSKQTGKQKPNKKSKKK